MDGISNKKFHRPKEDGLSYLRCGQFEDTVRELRTRRLLPSAGNFTPSVSYRYPGGLKIRKSLDSNEHKVFSRLLETAQPKVSAI